MELLELEQFGVNVLDRVQEIKAKKDESKETFTIEFGGGPEKLPVIRVRLGFPVYRLANGRTKTYQLEHLALNPELPSDFFERDNDAISAQLAQHEVLSRLVGEENLLKSFKNNEKQIQPLICTKDGVVVNGNRRLCAWRTLYLSDPTRYSHFETIDIAVLPECDERAIVTLEEKLQIHKEKRAEYKWHAKAKMAQIRLQNGAKKGDVARAFELSSQGLTNLLEALKLADKYLTVKGVPNQWSLVDKEYHAFDKLYRNSKKFNGNQGDYELFETLVFDMIEAGDSDGRMYELIDDLADNFDAIKEGLKEHLNIESEEQNDPALDFLAGEEIVPDTGSQIAKVINQADDNAVKEILGKTNTIIQNENAVRAELDQAVYLLNKVTSAATVLRGAVDQGLKEGMETEGVQAQLESIKQSISAIEEWLVLNNGMDH